jgi:ABC-type sugar transport system substrate-binding protein
MKMSEESSLSRRQFLKIAGMAGATLGAGAGLGALIAACGGETTTTTTATTAAGSTTTVAAGGVSEVFAATTTTVSPAFKTLAEGGKSPIKVGIAMVAQDALIFQACNDYYREIAAAFTKATGREVVIDSRWAEWDVLKQVNQFDQLIAAKVDVIVCSPADAVGVKTSIQKMHDAGVKFITLGRGADPTITPAPDCQPVAAAEENAYADAMRLFSDMKKNGVEPKVIDIMGNLDDANGVQRDAGYTKACAEAKVPILSRVRSDWDSNKVLSGLSAAMTAQPDATCILAATDYNLDGVQSALQRFDRWVPVGDPKHMYIACVDCYPVGLRALQGGYLDVCSIEPIWEQTTAAFNATVALVDGQPVNPLQYFSAIIATPANIGAIVDSGYKFFGKDYFSTLK